MRRTKRYSEYLRTRDWKQRRFACMQAHGWMCQYAGCGERASDAHHGDLKSSNYRNLFSEAGDDLIPLCRDHHDEVHRYIKAERNKRAVRTFAEKKYGHDWEDRYSEWEMEEDWRDWVEQRGGSIEDPAA